MHSVVMNDECYQCFKKLKSVQHAFMVHPVIVQAREQHTLQGKSEVDNKLVEDIAYSFLERIKQVCTCNGIEVM